MDANALKPARLAIALLTALGNFAFGVAALVYADTAEYTEAEVVGMDLSVYLLVFGIHGVVTFCVSLICLCLSYYDNACVNAFTIIEIVIGVVFRAIWLGMGISLLISSGFEHSEEYAMAIAVVVWCGVSTCACGTIQCLIGCCSCIYAVVDC